MGYADLHVHSIHSHDGTAAISAILKYAADFTRLDVIAITDHDSMNGVAEAMDLAPKYKLEVIAGCEISSAEGHVLALFINRPVQAGLSFLETVMRVGEQGGLCVAAHPMAKGTSSLSFEAIQQALTHPDAAQILVGIEAFNGGLVYTRSNQEVADASSRIKLAQVGNSDAHILSMIGEGSSFFIGSTAQDLRYALENHCTIPIRGKGMSGSSVLASYIPRYVLRKLGWVSWNANPNDDVKFARISQITARTSLRSVGQS